MELKFGADPELFVAKNGVFHSGYGLIKGDKENPFPVQNGAVQVDGMALEFNINPVQTEQEFVHNITSVLGQLKDMVPEYDLVAAPVAEFTPEYLEAQPEEAKMLGCDPDFNAWEDDQNETPDAKVSFRTGSGHIHIGWTDNQNIKDTQHKKQAQAVVKQMDFFLGLPSVIFDADTKRRELYGKAGAHRIKTYGVEYRVLSNKWLESEKLMAWAFRASKKALTELVKGNALHIKYGDIQDIINSSNVEKARQIIDEVGIELPEV